MIRALIFDFDGLILDTEKPDYDIWCDIYREYGCELPLDRYLNIIGTSLEQAGFVPFEHLVELTGLDLDRAEVEGRAHAGRLALIDAQPVLPGVEAHIQEARARGLKLAVASSSPLAWVERHLRRVGLFDCFDAIITSDDVERVKPAPDLFEAALAALGVAPEEAIVYEDSAHGIEAARAAGIYAVAVPNFLTRHVDLSRANVQISSLADVTLGDLLSGITNGKR
ncbi:MAG TPA: HAD family hydrolase [Aggregatilineales bacterium]|nr:HAD family hydrolase [Aggregatilineales bacterium]HQA69771.1 HAD family hydrolase [Aggregatilineales bacterium]HQE19072.1 HAD family hydrolase [Aggregatilineales bacterium]